MSACLIIDNLIWTCIYCNIYYVYTQIADPHANSDGFFAVLQGASRVPVANLSAPLSAWLTSPWLTRLLMRGWQRMQRLLEDRRGSH